MTITAFQNNAFQTNAFQIEGVPPPIIIIDDTHDGIYRKKLDDEHKRYSYVRKQSIINAYERLVENKIDVVEEIVKEFSIKPKKSTKYILSPKIDFDRLMQNVDKVEALWRAYIDMDDEDILVLM